MSTTDLNEKIYSVKMNLINMEIYSIPKLLNETHEI